MAIDLFNNISNDYIYPDLPPCPGMGDGDSYTFEFLPNQQIGVVSGSDIVASMDLNDIVQSISGWIQQSKILESGEVIFIPGMTKGISKRSQFFPFEGCAEYTGANHSLYMNVDISLNYFKSFKHHDINISVESNADDFVTIENALNIKFDEEGLPIDVKYSKEGLTFTGKNIGYLFDVYNVFVTLSEPDTSICEEELKEDLEVSIPAFKYPNGGMLGYVLKAEYPNKAAEHESFIKINHVPDFLEYFEINPDATLGNCYIRKYKAVDVALTKSCDDDTLSAPDYLHYIDTYDKWEKVGPIRIWLSAYDPPNSSDKNLITGFYVFNPQSFPIKISYMTIL